MEDKSFELLTKMYSDITNRLDGIDTKLEGIDSRLDKVEGHITTLENKLDNNSKVLFDGYHQTYEKLEVIEYHASKDPKRGYENPYFL